jgi:signal transduction histidine kinase/ligand-binding sensor domain-containing protein
VGQSFVASAERVPRAAANAFQSGFWPMTSNTSKPPASGDCQACDLNWLWLYVMLIAAVVAIAATPAQAALPQIGSETPFLIKTWQTEDGLPENSATAMVQTPDGYLWFGTFNGLVRFDGVNFTVFDPGNVPEMPSPGVVNLHLDRRGWLWVSTLGGIVVHEANRWRAFHKAAATEGDYVRSFAERANGDLLMTFYNGRILEFVADRLTELPSPPNKLGGGYLGASDESGHWWVVQRGFIGKWAETNWVPAFWGTNLPVKQGDPIGLAPARDGGFWLLLNRDLWKYRRGRVALNRSMRGAEDSIPMGSISTMAEDRSGNIWIAFFDAGLIQLLPDGRARAWDESKGLSYRDVRFVFEDQERSLWIGTSGGGLQRFRPRRFQTLGSAEGTAPRVVNSVAAASDGTVWFASFGQGFFHLGPEGLKRQRLPDWRDNSMFFQSVLADKNGGTWVGIFGEGLHRFDAHGGQHFPPDQIGGAEVTALFEDSRARIWLSTGRGVAVFEEGGLKTYGERQGVPPGRVCAFTEDRDGRLWLSNLESVFRLENGRFQQVLAPDGRLLRGVTSLKADDDRTMWMGSLDQGLSRWREGALATIDERAGLPVRGVFAILEDDRNFFWLPSSRGIVRASRAALQAAADGQLTELPCQLLDLSDGLPSVEFPSQRQPTCARDQNGRLWFATSKGVAMADPSQFPVNSVPPLVRIEEITYLSPPSGSLTDREEPHRVLAPFPERPQLPAGSRDIEIHYTAPSFAAPHKVRFKVKLEGQDSDWHNGDATRSDRFRVLPPRSYVFRVRAANDDGVWNESGTSLTFAVLPHYWQTWYFRLGAALMLVTAGAAAVWRWSHERVKRALERERVVSELHQLRMELTHSNRVFTLGQLASALAHELNQPLGAILRNAEAGEMLLDQEHPDLPEIRSILSDIRLDDHRAGGIIDRMRALLKRRDVEQTEFPVLPFLSDTEALARPDADARKVRLNVQVPPDLPPALGDPVQLQQVLLNLLINAMDAMSQQPVGNRRLDVGCRRTEGGMLEFSVRDTGPGISPPAFPKLFDPFFTTKPQGMGLGLPISRTIIEAHGGQLWAENDPEGGACFRFTVPQTLKR